MSGEESLERYEAKAFFGSIAAHETVAVNRRTFLASYHDTIMGLTAIAYSPFSRI